MSLKRHWVLAATLIVTGLAAWLRFDSLTRAPLWLDEAYSAFAAEKGIGFIWTILPTYETHPPFYSSLLWGWTAAFGSSLASLRSFGGVAGLIALGLFWLTARQLGKLMPANGQWLPLAALAMLAVSPSIIAMTRTVRPYNILILVNALTCWAMLRLINRVRSEGRIDHRDHAIFLACVAALAWLHSLGALYAGAAVIGLAIALGWQALQTHWKTLLAGQAIVGLASLPALLIVADQAPTWQKSSWLSFVPENLFPNIMLIFGWLGIFSFALGLALVANAIVGLKASDRRIGAGLVAMAAFPVAAAIILSITVAPVFLARTLVAASIPLLLLAAAGGCASFLWRGVLAIQLGLMLVASIGERNLPPEQDWYKAIDWLAPRIGPDDMIYAYPNEGALPLRYALRDKGINVAIRAIPGEVPSHDPQGWYPSGNRAVQLLPPARLAQIADDDISRKTPTIWLLRLGPSAYDKQDMFLNIIRERRDEMAHFILDPIDIVGLKRREPR